MNILPDIAAPPARVLIVDDERHDRRLLEVMLAAEGFELLTASSGEEALGLVTAQPPDLVLLDLMMPGMDGYAVAGELKGNPATRNIALIMITARDDRDARMRGLKAGADDFLAKPVDRAELRLRVRNLIRLKAYGEYSDKYSQMLEGEVVSRTGDLIERTKALEQQAAVLTEQAALLDLTQDAIVVHDMQGRILFWSRGAEAMYGWLSEEALGRTTSELLNAEFSDAAADIEATLLRQGRWEGEATHTTRTGARLIVASRWALQRDAQAAPVRVLTINNDISERKRVEVVARRLAAIVLASDDAIIGLTAGGVIESWNTGAQRLYDYAADDVAGRSVLLLVPPDRAPEIEGILAQVRRGESVSRYEAVSVTRTGREIHVAITMSPIRDGQGAVTGASMVARDITDLRRAAEELHQREEQLRQAQKMEAVGRLAGGIAHDFNNLLTVIAGRSQMMFDLAGEDARLRKQADVIRSSAARAATLTRQLLAFSRKQVLQPAVLDLNDVVRQMLTILHRLIGENVELTFTPHKALGRVRADRGQLEQVIMNLVVNARDAMPDGGRVEVETANVTLGAALAPSYADLAPGPYVVLSVSDTGCGMSPDVQRRIFEPFFTTKPVDQGTGLGLATVYGVVKQSGGEVLVDSEVGRGTCFTVYLPLVDGEAQHEPEEPGPSLVTARETVLLVEDESDVRELVQEILRRAGYTVLAARHPGEALLIGERHPAAIHVLLTDVIMPQMNGPELAERLAAVRPDLRVVYMSGYTDTAIGHQGVLPAGTTFLQKPFSAAAMLRTLRELLDR